MFTLIWVAGEASKKFLKHSSIICTTHESVSLIQESFNSDSLKHEAAAPTHSLPTWQNFTIIPWTTIAVESVARLNRWPCGCGRCRTTFRASRAFEGVRSFSCATYYPDSFKERLIWPLKAPNSERNHCFHYCARLLQSQRTLPNSNVVPVVVCIKSWTLKELRALFLCLCPLFEQSCACWGCVTVETH